MVITSVCISLVISTIAGTDGFDIIQRQFKKSVHQFNFNVSVQEKTRVVSVLNCFVQCRQLPGCLGVQYQIPTASCTKYRLSQSSSDALVTLDADVWYVKVPHKYVGCFTDGPDRTLDVSVGVVAGLTAEKCKMNCTNYSLFGTEFAHECYCGDVMNNRAREVNNSQCKVACAGDPRSMCGGYWRLSVYQVLP